MESKKNNNVPLPDELIVQILLRLPVKSLLRFRCVSKSWLSLISNPYFTKSHFDLAAAPTHRLLYISDSGFEVRSIDIDASLHDVSATVKLVPPLPSSTYPLQNFRILGSCRGLILLDDCPNLLLWNPSIGIHKTLSYSTISSNCIYEYAVVYGFGYDASTDDYLLVVAWIESGHSEVDLVLTFECFSLRTNSWTEIEGIHFPYKNLRSQCGLLSNGAFHWLVFRDDGSCNVIIAFDLIQKNLFEVFMPDHDFFDGVFGDLWLLRGCLSLCYWSNNKTEIWVMKNYKVQLSWTKYEIKSYIFPICAAKGGELVAIGSPGQLVKFNVKGEQLEHCIYFDDLDGCVPVLYTESLLYTPPTQIEAGEERKNMENKKNFPLPKELIQEILLRLPVKSLVRFKCVCKSWLSLISDPHFAKSHFELAATPTHRLVYITDTGSEARSIDFEASLHDDSAVVKLDPPLPSPSGPTPIVVILGSCRGFILLEKHPNLFIWNPSIGVHKRLSYSAIGSKFFELYDDFTLLYGFGYDPSTDDYLVVIAWIEDNHSDDNFMPTIEYFSLRTNSWKEIEVAHFPYMHPCNQSGLLFNGKIHWLAWNSDLLVGKIIAFDLIERNFLEIPLPDGLIDCESCDLRVLGGCLSLCNRCELIEIWVMKEYKLQSSWTKSIVLDPSDVADSTYFSVICFTKRGDIVGSDGNVSLVKFNGKGELLEHRAYCPNVYECMAAMYTESLLSLPGDCGEAREDDQQ